jgi:hypothetical protein
MAQVRAAPSLPSVLSRWGARTAPVAFAIAFTGTLAVALIQGAKPFYGDSASYWSLATSFTRNGHFSLLNFESPVRGYALPLINYVLEAFGNGVHWTQSSVAKVFNVMLFAVIGTVLAPQIAENTWPQHRWNVPRRIALTTLLIVFWSGYLNYPLSDFPGLALALLALVAIARPDKAGAMLIAGIAVGLAIDVRPAYLPLAPMLVVIVALTWFDRRRTQHGGPARRVLCMGLLVVGVAVASLPQSLTSDRHYHTWSFLPGGPAHLTQEQLTKGMYLQRYDTFVEPPASAFQVVYRDEAGMRLMRQVRGGAITSSGQYMEMIVDHPVTMAGLIARHIINGLDMRYSTVYVEHLDSGGHLWLRLPGFLLVFLALVRVLWPAARRGLGPARWRYPVALLACCLTSVVTAIETRYMLPVWLLGSMLVLIPGWPSPIDRGKAGLQRFRTLAILAVAYLAFLAVVWHVVSGATARVLT